MSERVSIRLHMVLLACAVAMVLAVTMWRVPGLSREAALSVRENAVMANVSVASSEAVFRKDESRVPIRN